MIEKLIEFLKDKNIIILGFGMEGETTYDFIRNHLPTQKLTIADMNEVIIEDYPYLEQDKNLTLILGKNYLDNLEQYDVIIKDGDFQFGRFTLHDGQVSEHNRYRRWR